MINSKKISHVLLIGTITLLVAGCQTASNNSVSNPSTNAIKETMPTPSQNPDPTKDWKTFTNTNYGYSFKYPQAYVVEERVPGFVVITSPTEHIAQAGISIDSRIEGSYANYEDAKNTKLSNLNVSETKTIASWEIIEGADKDGMLKDVSFRYGLAHYKTGTIAAETRTISPYKELFDQILATFEFSQ